MEQDRINLFLAILLLKLQFFSMILVSAVIQANHTFNLTECEFEQATISYSVKHVGRGQVWPLEAKVQAIVHFRFDKHQRNNTTIEKEALALVLALQHFEVYVGSSRLPLMVYTDHNPLVFLHRK